MNLIGLLLFFNMFIFFTVPDFKSKNFNNTYTNNIYSSLISILFKFQNWIVAIYACLLWTPMSVIGSLYGVPFIQAYFNYSKILLINEEFSEKRLKIL